MSSHTIAPSLTEVPRRKGLRSPPRAMVDGIMFCGGKGWLARKASQEGGQAVAATENEKIFIGPDEGAHLPILGITHKVTAEHFGGAFTSIEGRIPPATRSLPIPTPARTSAP